LADDLFNLKPLPIATAGQANNYGQLHHYRNSAMLNQISTAATPMLAKPESTHDAGDHELASSLVVDAARKLSRSLLPRSR
jgi:hypothetical protein